MLHVHEWQKDQEQVTSEKKEPTYRQVFINTFKHWQTQYEREY